MQPEQQNTSEEPLSPPVQPFERQHIEPLQSSGSITADPEPAQTKLDVGSIYPAPGLRVETHGTPKPKSVDTGTLSGIDYFLILTIILDVFLGSTLLFPPIGTLMNALMNTLPILGLIGLLYPFYYWSIIFVPIIIIIQVVRAHKEGRSLGSARILLMLISMAVIVLPLIILVGTLIFYSNTYHPRLL